ncbi:TauD/TfdA family dioxygenase [Paenibacillus sp. B01]|uniref:TauD/TfdA family dioxygenase n=1 Tax=Paenibacillus sp. B01 TaxID=2660554 RepID=UPI00129B69BA|nr:hypothetical protein GE073_21555 [Paenibacillus sp. B01]
MIRIIFSTKIKICDLNYLMCCIRSLMEDIVFLTTLYNCDPYKCYFRIDRDCMKPTSLQGIELLKTIDSLICQKDIYEVEWNSGDLLILDNWIFLHGRGESNVVDNDRLLLRISIKER